MPGSRYFSTTGRVYAARSMIVGEEDLLKIGFSENIDARFPDGDYVILFSRPDEAVPRFRDIRVRRRLGGRWSWTVVRPKKEGFVERSVLAYCEELGLRAGLENVGRRQEGGGNGWTELVRFDLEAAQIIRANLRRAAPEAQTFLRIALRFAGNQPSKPTDVLRFEIDPLTSSDRMPRRRAIPAPDLLPHVDMAWDGSDTVPDIDHPPEEMRACPQELRIVHDGSAGYDDQVDDEAVGASWEEVPDVGDAYEDEGLTVPRGPGAPDVGSDELHGFSVRRF